MSRNSDPERNNSNGRPTPYWSWVFSGVSGIIGLNQLSISFGTSKVVHHNPNGTEQIVPHHPGEFSFVEFAEGIVLIALAAALAAYSWAVSASNIVGFRLTKSGIARVLTIKV